jgi:hypothetical protein
MDMGHCMSLGGKSLSRLGLLGFAGGALGRDGSLFPVSADALHRPQASLTIPTSLFPISRLFHEFVSHVLPPASTARVFLISHCYVILLQLEPAAILLRTTDQPSILEYDPKTVACTLRQAHRDDHGSFFTVPPLHPCPSVLASSQLAARRHISHSFFAGSTQ